MKKTNFDLELNCSLPPLSLYEHFQLYVNYALGLPIALFLGKGSEFREFVLNWKTQKRFEKWLLKFQNK